MDQQDRNLHHFMQYCQPIIHLLPVMPSCHLIITTGEVNHVKRALTYFLNQNTKNSHINCPQHRPCSDHFKVKLSYQS